MTRVAELEQHLGNFATALSLYDDCEEAKAPLHAAFEQISLPTVEELCESPIGEPHPKLAQRNALRQAMTPFQAYQDLALRDSAMTVYHFRHVLASVREHLTPTLRKLVDTKKLRAAWKLFSRDFPNYEHNRNAIAHAGELNKTLDHRRENSIDGPFEAPGITIGEGARDSSLYIRRGRTLLQTYNRRVIEVTLSSKEFESLKEVYNLVLEAFDGAAVASRVMAAEQLRARQASVPPFPDESSHPPSRDDPTA